MPLTEMCHIVLGTLSLLTAVIRRRYWGLGLMYTTVVYDALIPCYCLTGNILHAHALIYRKCAAWTSAKGALCFLTEMAPLFQVTQNNLL
jgi:hypothetical protein